MIETDYSSLSIVVCCYENTHAQRKKIMMVAENCLFLCEKKELVDFSNLNRLSIEVVCLLVNFSNFLFEKKEKRYDLVYFMDIVDAKRKPSK